MYIHRIVAMHGLLRVWNNTLLWRHSVAVSRPASYSRGAKYESDQEIRNPEWWFPQLSSVSSGICHDSILSRLRELLSIGYGLDDRSSRVRFPARAGNFFLHHHVQNGSGASPIQWVPVALSLEVRWSRREADHSPPSSAEVKEWVELYLHSPNTPSWRDAQCKKKSVATTLHLPLPLSCIIHSHATIFISCYITLAVNYASLNKPNKKAAVSDFLSTATVMSLRYVYVLVFQRRYSASWSSPTAVVLKEKILQSNSLLNDNMKSVTPNIWETSIWTCKHNRYWAYSRYVEHRGIKFGT
jgi:hypothetical protein